MLEHLHNEFIHVPLNPQCVYLRVYIPCFGGQELYTFLIFQQLEVLSTLTWRKIAGRYFQDQEFAMNSPSDFNPERSLESPESHQPKPNTISISEFSCGL